MTNLGIALILGSIFGLILMGLCKLGQIFIGEEKIASFFADDEDEEEQI